MRRVAEALLIVLAAALFTAAVLPPGALAGAAPAGEPAALLLPLDDAYIFVRFAQQFARGRPFEWADGQRSSGATSLAYLGLLLPGQALGGGLAAWERWSRWVGLASLALLGLAAAWLLRELALPPPWPLAGALCVVLSGPVGWGALAGMESALNAAAVVLAAACWARLAPGPPSSAGALAAAALSAAVLPWVRPENLVLSLAAAGAVLTLPAWRGRRWLAVPVVLPAGLLLALNLWLTGDPRPAGSIVKSITEFAFVDPTTLAALYGLNLVRKLLPVYLGTAGELLWLPAGWLALAGAGWAVAGALRGREACRRAAPAAAAWALLALVAPLSAVLDWQLMRHHHAGLALAWLLALWLAARLFERLRSRRGWSTGTRWAALALPALLLAALPLWRTLYAHSQGVVQRRHGPAAAWLAAQRPKPLLLVNDAGFLMVHHDGPAIDALGLGTPAMARPARHGPGAMAEALGRLELPPAVAAVNLDSFRLPELLGRRLLPPPAYPSDTVLAEVRAELLARTRLSAPGLDFAHLADERRWAARWTVEPSPLDASFAVVHGDGGATLDGCRPVPDRLAWRMPPSATGGVARVFAPPAADTRVELLSAGGARLAAAAIGAGAVAELRFEGAAGGAELARLGGGLPCLESVVFAGAGRPAPTAQAPR